MIKISISSNVLLSILGTLLCFGFFYSLTFYFFKLACCCQLRRGSYCDLLVMHMSIPEMYFCLLSLEAGCFEMMDFERCLCVWMSFYIAPVTLYLRPLCVAF